MVGVAESLPHRAVESWRRNACRDRGVAAAVGVAVGGDIRSDCMTGSRGAPTVPILKDGKLRKTILNRQVAKVAKARRAGVMDLLGKGTGGGWAVWSIRDPRSPIRDLRPGDSICRALCEHLAYGRKGMAVKNRRHEWRGRTVFRPGVGYGSTIA